MHKIYPLLGVAFLGLVASGRAAAQTDPVVHDPAPSGVEIAHDSTNGHATVETPGKDAAVSDHVDSSGKEHINFDRDGVVGHTDMDHTTVDHDNDHDSGDNGDHDSGDHDSGDHGGDHDSGDHGGDHDGGDHGASDHD